MIELNPLLALGSYLLGAIPAAYIVTRALGKDVVHFGDRNIGAVNAYYATGKIWVFLLVLLFDAGKAFVTTYFLGPVYGLITVFGHIFFRFHIYDYPSYCEWCRNGKYSWICPRV